MTWRLCWSVNLVYKLFRKVITFFFSLFVSYFWRTFTTLIFYIERNVSFCIFYLNDTKATESSENITKRENKHEDLSEFATLLSLTMILLQFILNKEVTHDLNERHFKWTYLWVLYHKLQCVLNRFISIGKYTACCVFLQ